VSACAKCGRDTDLAAALRRQAHELDHLHVIGMDETERDARAERFRERADKLDGSGP
jgi:hypothetical protein